MHPHMLRATGAIRWRAGRSVPGPDVIRQDGTWLIEVAPDESMMLGDDGQVALVRQSP